MEEILPQCPWLGGGLVGSDLWTNDRCRYCEFWQNGTFVILNPMTDLGWNVLIDPLVFFLKQAAPTLLTFIQTPSNFPFPINLFIASATWQSWTHRWDSVDINANPIIFRQVLLTTPIGNPLTSLHSNGLPLSR